jgi:hypothetical protein
MLMIPRGVKVEVLKHYLLSFMSPGEHLFTHIPASMKKPATQDRQATVLQVSQLVGHATHVPSDRYEFAGQLSRQPEV